MTKKRIRHKRDRQRERIVRLQKQLQVEQADGRALAGRNNFLETQIEQAKGARKNLAEIHARELANLGESRKQSALVQHRDLWQLRVQLAYANAHRAEAEVRLIEQKIEANTSVSAVEQSSRKDC